MQVLQEKMQISKARQELIGKNLSFICSPLTAFLRRFGIIDGVTVGDKVKSWDVLTTLNFIEKQLEKNAPILDIGCYASEVITALHKLGYSNLTGVDLNPGLQKMPYSDVIRYEIGNFMYTKFEDASFQAITSISVIEHGFEEQPLLREMSRLLKPGGYFIASFDYWPDKIDTTGVKIFGMDWKIFSEQEILTFVSHAANYGLFPVGEMISSSRKKVINCAERQYTFAWLSLKKEL
jgi:SAM-dependent methyltransferase